MRRLLVPFLGAMIVALSGCAPAPLPADEVRTPVPDFALLERGGRTVSRDDLQGKVWIASFVYTSCCTECPQMMGVLARLQHEWAGEKDVLLVSFSVDPNRDSPEILQQYGNRYGADPERWLFLTGEQEKVYPLVQKGFLLGVEQNKATDRNPGSAVMHSQKLAVVDRQGRIRGYYDALDEAKRVELKQKVAALLREKP